MSRPICVETPLGGAVTLYGMCKDFEIDFAGRVLYADLIMLGLAGFVIILGADCLRKHFVTLDGARRTINIDITSRSWLIHTYSGRRVLVRTSLLCSVEISKQNISEVDVVCEFEGIFQETHRPSPRRVVELCIDLVSGIAPGAFSLLSFLIESRDEILLRCVYCSDPNFLKSFIYYYDYYYLI